MWWSFPSTLQMEGEGEGREKEGGEKGGRRREERKGVEAHLGETEENTKGQKLTSE